MAKYVLKFSKEGFFKYTSHLDLLRFYKRSFKRLGIKLAYSQGFNPHPKMGFAQPLSLGYSSIAEYLEFETQEQIPATDIREKLVAIMPEGLKIQDCVEYTREGKTLAGQTVAADYVIAIPLNKDCGDITKLDANKLCHDFMAQEQIVAKKRQKKTKEFVDVDFKDKIRKVELAFAGPQLIISTSLDAGSDSNASPELLIEALLKFTGWNIERYDIEVMRKKIYFANGFEM